MVTNQSHTYSSSSHILNSIDDLRAQKGAYMGNTRQDTELFFSSYSVMMTDPVKSFGKSKKLWCLAPQTLSFCIWEHSVYSWSSATWNWICRENSALHKPQPRAHKAFCLVLFVTCSNPSHVYEVVYVYRQVCSYMLTSLEHQWEIIWMLLLLLMSC